MHRIALTWFLLTGCLLAGLGAEPPNNRLLTQPRIPTDVELGRLGLQRQWVANVGTQGRRDGLHSIQAFPGQIVTQTRAGTVVALDAETGAKQWQVHPGGQFEPYQRPVGGNKHYFFVYSGLRLYGVERRTGQIEWSLDLPTPLAVAPSADEASLYLSTSDNKVRAYFLPLARQAKSEAEVAAFNAMLAKRGIRMSSFASGQPKEIWSFDVGCPLSEPPAAFGSHIVLGDSRGYISAFENSRRNMTDRVGTGGPIVGAIAHDGDMAYVASTDHHLYAMELVGGRLERRYQFTTGSRITEAPVPLAGDLYLAAEKDGLYALDRATGQMKWRQPKASRFLAASPRLVFAADPTKRLLALDRQRGTLLGSWDASDYAFILANPHSDRVYLGNHNGLVVCLRDAHPLCARPQKYECRLSSAMEAVAKEFRGATADAAKVQAEEAAKDAAAKATENEGDKPAAPDKSKSGEGADASKTQKKEDQ